MANKKNMWTVHVSVDRESGVRECSYYVVTKSHVADMANQKCVCTTVNLLPTQGLHKAVFACQEIIINYINLFLAALMESSRANSTISPFHYSSTFVYKCLFIVI